MNRTMVAAHTGCGVHPDNTMASFLEGMELGADIVEVDVRATRDGTAILLHDDSPYLLTHDFNQLNEPDVRKRLDPLYADYEIATLEQALKASASRGTKLNLDLKSAAAIVPTVRLIRQYEAQNRAYITGCSDRMTELYPDIQVMMNTPDELSPQQLLEYEQFAESVCLHAQKQGYVGLNMDARTCRKTMVERAHFFGLKVWVYTVNRRQDMELCLEAGVDAITTRKPEILLELLREC
ncbi:glycerophosphodiester phosphodiesterase [Cohnella soli]|uniref:Glycerophosphodiester phosphodiesterase n=1 Tax=Cohnella soli TaxID=425005 RepID=A0ABW0HR51_9BACL